MKFPSGRNEMLLEGWLRSLSNSLTSRAVKQG
jgi:hypothetical protein